VTEVELRRPDERTCERCGRHEEWVESWRVRVVGDRFCVHEWDINGSFVPLRAVSDPTDD
jgi:hypothetical protein